MKKLSSPVRIILPCLAAILLITGTGVSPDVQASVTAVETSHTFRATLEHRFNPTRQLLGRSRVTVSADGYRLEALPLTLGQLIIANTLSGKTWFVDTYRSLIHEVPFTVVTGAPKLEESFISLPGSIDSIPCSFYGGTRLDDVQRNGRSLERWRCRIDHADGIQYDDLPAEQYYSREYKLVLYSRTRGNVVSELLNIRKSPVDRALFTAPEGLQAVTIEQFLGQTRALGPYQPPSGNVE